MDALRDGRQRRVVREALAALGKRRLVLSIHDASFPSAPGQDPGRGSPYARGGADFLAFTAALGFNGVLFGPQGQTSRVNPSPYDGTLFSRSVLSIDPFALAGEPPGDLLPPAVPEALVRDVPDDASGRARYLHLFDAQPKVLRAAFSAFRARPHSPLRDRLADFRARNGEWLERDGLFGALLLLYGDRSPRDWEGAHADLDRRLYHPRPGEEAAAAARLQSLKVHYAEELAFHAFCQFLLEEQHGALRTLAADLGLRLYGDLQIGVSQQDLWSYGDLFLSDYLMGAPPSRTNPEGQPWGYPVFDPERYDGPGGADRGPVRAMLRARVSKMLAEFDGVRIDHPHGLICPWVYAAGAGDPLAAVQGGARLFSSPDLPDHPALARYAIPGPAQLDRAVPRYDDGWERWLTPEQVARYSVLFDEIVACAAEHGRDRGDLLCEVLSTQPYPLAQVMKRHGLGRFRVTQKASLDDPADGYRSENAAPPDWVMVGNHDTAPLWRLLPDWGRRGLLPRRAAYLAERLGPDAESRPALARRLAAEPALLGQALFADLFASPAENVLVFFSDLLGLAEIYNAPGTVSDDNWSLRVPQDYARDYAARLGAQGALNLPLALAMALRARAGAERHGPLLRELDALAACGPVPGAPPPREST